MIETWPRRSCNGGYKGDRSDVCESNGETESVIVVVVVSERAASIESPSGRGEEWSCTYPRNQPNCKVWTKASSLCGRGCSGEGGGVILTRDDFTNRRTWYLVESALNVERGTWTRSNRRQYGVRIKATISSDVERWGEGGENFRCYRGCLLGVKERVMRSGYEYTSEVFTSHMVFKPSRPNECQSQ